MSDDSNEFCYNSNLPLEALFARDYERVSYGDQYPYAESHCEKHKHSHHPVFSQPAGTLLKQNNHYPKRIPRKQTYSTLIIQRVNFGQRKTELNGNFFQKQIDVRFWSFCWGSVGFLSLSVKISEKNFLRVFAEFGIAYEKRCF